MDIWIFVLISANKIYSSKGVQTPVDDKQLYKKMNKAHNLYGDGKVVEEIIKYINFI